MTAVQLSWCSRAASRPRASRSPTAARARRRRRRPERPKATSRATISIIGVWTGAEQSLPGGDRRLQQADPDVRSSTRRPATSSPTRALDRGRRAATRPTSRRSPQPGPRAATSRRGRAEADRLRAERRSTRTSRRVRSQLGTVNGKLYGFLFKAANKSTVWYNVRVFKDAGVKPPKTWDAARSRTAKTITASGRPGVLDRRRRRVDAHRPLREHLPAPAGPDKYDQLADARDPLDGPVRQGRARRRWRRSSATRGNIAGGTARRAADGLPDLGHATSSPTRRRPRR